MKKVRKKERSRHQHTSNTENIIIIVSIIDEVEIKENNQS